MTLLKTHKISLARREALAGYAFIIPWIIGFLVFTIGPMLASLYYSFTDYNIVDPPRWVGPAVRTIADDTDQGSLNTSRPATRANWAIPFSGNRFKSPFILLRSPCR